MQYRFILAFILVLLSSPIFSQQVTKNPDGKSITITATKMLFFAENGDLLTIEQFNDSLASGRYISSTEFRGSEAWNYLENKMPNVVGKQLPEIELKTINGDMIKYGESGKVTLLSFWSVVCKPCIEELIELNAWASGYSDVRIIAIAKDSISIVSEFMKKNNYSWPNISIVPGYKGDFDSVFRINAWPLNVITDDRRVVRKIFIGKDSELTDYICSLL